MKIEDLAQFYQIIDNHKNQGIHTSFIILSNKFKELLEFLCLDAHKTVNFRTLSQMITANSLALQKCELSQETILNIAKDIEKGGSEIVELIGHDQNSLSEITHILLQGKREVLSIDSWQRQIKDELHSYFNCSRPLKKEDGSVYHPQELFDELKNLLNVMDGNELYQMGKNNLVNALMICSTPALVRRLEISSNVPINNIIRIWSQQHPEYKHEITSMFKRMTEANAQYNPTETSDLVQKK